MIRSLTWICTGGVAWGLFMLYITVAAFIDTGNYPTNGSPGITVMENLTGIHPEVTIVSFLVCSATLGIITRGESHRYILVAWMVAALMMIGHIAGTWADPGTNAYWLFVQALGVSILFTMKLGLFAGFCWIISLLTVLVNPWKPELSVTE